MPLLPIMTRIIFSIPARTLLFCLSLVFFFAATLRPQSAIAVPNATVTPDTLKVYSEMATSSTPAGSLKKGDAVIVDFEIKTTEKWCSVRLPTQTAKLGFVQCKGLARQPLKFEAAGVGTSLDRGTGSSSPFISSQSSRHGAKDLAVTPPPVRSGNGYAEIQREIIHEDVIDINKLASLESAAKNGSALAMTRAAQGHYAAGNFELSRNSPDEAIEQFQAALSFAAKDTNLLLANLLSLAYVRLVRGEYGAALEYLDRSRKIAPNSAAVAQLSGWAYYALDRLPEAVTEWKRSQSIQPSPTVAQALEKIQRDADTESGFREGQTRHFSMHYQGNATPQLATEILRALEDDFRSLETQLRFAPAEPIAVILYTQETFHDITRAPGWASALNDGRLRIPIRGLTSVTDELSRVLMHELTHSFVVQKTLGRCPTWLNEGLAQYMEGRRSETSARFLIASYDQHSYIPLQHLEGGWSRFPAPAAAFAYAWGLAATESIIADSGMYGLERFFEHFSNDTAVEPALREAFQANYADVERNTANYLRRTYTQ
jgi:predicted negative regulator of RcsB-dependent stress response